MAAGENGSPDVAPRGSVDRPEGAGVLPVPQAVVRARFQLARLEYIRASAWWARRDRGQLALGLIFGLAAVVSGPNAIAGGTPIDVVLFAVLAILAASKLTGWSCAPTIWLAFRRRPDIYGVPWTLEAREDGLVVRMGPIENRFPWARAQRIRSSPTHVFLGFGQACVIVPAMALAPAAVDAFIALAEAARAAPPAERASGEAPGGSAGMSAAAPAVPAGASSAAVSEAPAGISASVPAIPAGAGPAAAPAVRQGGPFVEVVYPFSTGDAARATIWLAQRSAASVSVSLAIGALGAFMMFGPSEIREGYAVLGVPWLLVGVAGCTGLLYVPLVWLQGWRQRDLARRPATIRADGHGLVFVSAFGGADASWASFRRVRESGRFLFLDFGTGASIYLPKRAFSEEQLATVRSLIPMRASPPPPTGSG